MNFLKHGVNENRKNVESNRSLCINKQKLKEGNTEKLVNKKKFNWF